MRARQRRMTAEIDLDGGREPAEIVAVALGHQERRLGEIHLACDVQHPGGVGWFWEDADRGGVPSERFVGERVDLRDPEAHASKSIAIGLNGRAVATRASRPRSPDTRR